MGLFDKYLQPGRSARKTVPRTSVPQMSVNRPMGPPAPTMSVPKPQAQVQAVKPPQNMGGLLGKAFPSAFGGNSNLSTTSYGSNVLTQPSNFFSKPVVTPKPVPQMSVVPKAAPLTLEQLRTKNQATRAAAPAPKPQTPVNPAVADVGKPITPKPTPTPEQQQAVLGTGFQSQLDPMDPAAIGGAQMRPQLPQAPPLPPSPSPASEAPTQTAPSPEDQISSLRQRFLETFGVSPEEQEAEEALSGISTTASQEAARARQEYADRVKAIQDQATLQPFLTGRQIQASGQLTDQLQALEAATSAQTMPLQQRLAAIQARRNAERDRAEAELGFATSDREAQNVTPVEVGGRLVNPRTGEVIYEAPAEDAEAKTYTLSPGQRVVNAQGQVIAENPANGSGDKFTNVSPGSTVIDSMGNVVYRAPKEGEADAKAVASQVGELDTTISLVDEIVNNPAFNQVFGLSGAVDPRNYLPGQPAQYLKSQIEQLKAFLALENRQKLKGQGTISDREFKVLTDAATALNAKLGDEDARRELIKLRDALTGRKSELGGGGGGMDDPDFQALRNDPDLKNYSDAQIRDILGKTSEGSGSLNAQTKLQSVKIGNKNVVVRKEIAPRLEAAAKEFKALTGKDLQINQDYRSSEHQAELYRKSQAGQIGRAAPPGLSRHETGLAIDVTNWREAERVLRKYGFRNDLADDKNHFSLGEFV